MRWPWQHSDEALRTELAAVKNQLADLREQYTELRAKHLVSDPTTEGMKLVSISQDFLGGIGRQITLQYTDDPRSPSLPSFTCPKCGRTSFNPNDVDQGYCGACHDWTGDQHYQRAKAEATEPDV